MAGKPQLCEWSAFVPPERLLLTLQHESGTAFIRCGYGAHTGRYTIVAAQPFQHFRAFGSRCEIHAADGIMRQFGNPWIVLGEWLARYELRETLDLPFPLGACLGYWGYDLRNFVEPGIAARALDDLELPDCHVGFYDSLVACDHTLQKTWILATGLEPEGSGWAAGAWRLLAYWQSRLSSLAVAREGGVPPPPKSAPTFISPAVRSNLSRDEYIGLVRRAQAYLRLGHIYQVNLAQRFVITQEISATTLFLRLLARSPAPYAAFYDAGDFQLASASPELFLGLSGSQIVTRPIKGTRPRMAEPLADARMAFELQTSGKELSELVMITDLLRNDLGKICSFGSIQVPALARPERFSHVHHLVSTIEGELRRDQTHLSALASVFPGGSVTGAPKLRAMQIIEELEPIRRGPYTGCLGYLGFNRESQLAMTIRTAICRADQIFYYAGAGIVHESDPAAEYEETVIKARGFFEALGGVPCPLITLY